MTRITFATNTALNTLEYTKLLLKSLKENLDYNEHEILLFVDADNDGTVEYLRSIKSEFFDLKIITHNVKPIVGPERNINLIVELSSHDIVSYLQSDMVVSKHYDTEILKDIEKDCILSSTRIEPPLHGFSDKTFTANLGLSPEEFQWDEFLNYAESVKSERTIDYFFAPFSFYKKTWEKFGGFDTIFRRSRCDSDLVQRCMHLNIKLKQSYRSNVYHFTCVSSRGKNWHKKEDQNAQNRVELQNNADKIEIRKFIRKWGGFNHGDELLKKYDIDLVVKGDITNKHSFLYSIEPFFSRVWFENKKDRDSVMKLNDNEQVFANQLYRFTEEDWEYSKGYYNHTDYNSIYLVGEPKEYNIKIEIDLSALRPESDPFIQNLTNLYPMIEPLEPGVYELESTKIDIRNAVVISDKIHKVKNPYFDMSLLNIE